VGTCRISLKDGRWVGITGIEQADLAWLTRRRSTPGSRMVKELNDLLREHDGNSNDVPYPGGPNLI
jgi:hypothetical protein